MFLVSVYAKQLRVQLRSSNYQNCARIPIKVRQYAYTLWKSALFIEDMIDGHASCDNDEDPPVKDMSAKQMIGSHIKWLTSCQQFKP